MAINSRPADFRLEVGVEVGTSFQHMKEDITAIVRTLNKQPPKIKLSVDMASLSKDFNKLKTDINELRKEAGEIKFSNQISSSLTNIQSSLSTLTESVSGVTGLRTELESLATAMQNFQGINLNLGLSGNAANRNAAYGNAARAAIAEMQQQVNALHQAYGAFYHMANGRDAAMQGVSSQFGIGRFIEAADALGRGGLNEQAAALANYITLLQQAGREINGLNLAPTTSQFAHSADELLQNIERVANGEVELNANTERLRGIFSSGINAEALNEQLTAINTSITNANNAIGALGINEESLSTFRTSIAEIVGLINQLISSVERVNTSISGLAPREIVNRESLAEAVTQVNEATQATQRLDTTMSEVSTRAQEVAQSTQAATQATQENISATSQLSGNMSGLNSTLQTMEDTRLQEIANAELLRMAEEEEAAYANRANTALQNQIETMVGIGRQTKSAESSMLAFIAAEEEANRTFQNPMAAEAELRRIAQAATSARRLLGSNMEAAETGTDSYDRATAALEQLDRVLGYCHGNAELLAEALRVTGVNSVEEVTRLNTAVATLRDELQETGTGGTTSLRAVIDMLNQMQSLVGRNPNVTGGDGYAAITGQIELFQTIVRSCNGDVNALEQVLHDMGLQGSNVIENARLAMSNYRSEVVAATSDERANAGAVRDRNAAIREGEAAFRQHTAVATQAEKRLRQWSSAQYSSNEESRNAYQNLRNSVNALDAAARAYDGTEQSARDMAEAVRVTRTTMSETERVLRTNGDATQSLGDRIKGLATKFSSWLGVSQIIMYAVRAIKQMINSAREIDAAMTQLKIVTSATDGEMKQFANTATTLAKELGKSVTELTASIETFSRLGYSLKDASELAKYATIMSNVAGVDTEEATTGLTAIVKGYNLNVSDAEHVADVLVDVGQKYAVSAGELMEAYEKSGAALSATNTSLEKSAGLIAAANASVQDASVIGTALKTVSARIRGSKSDLEELGESTDDLAEGFSKYASEIKALTGFDIMIDESHFKDIYDIFEGISKTWSTLSDTQQARVSEILGGTRQLQVISSIIGNWKDAVGAYETSLNSAGASTKANDTYMESINAHIEQMNAAFEELSTTIMNSGVAKLVIDSGKTILEILTGISNLTGGLGTTLLTGGFVKGITSVF